ncbi:MAG: acyl-CoA dehydrogenase family protein [Planctomycetes bacterium]|nr:acyl-CoA dehydrogenase family protein [Planctomycetota bacterium]
MRPHALNSAIRGGLFFSVLHRTDSVVHQLDELQQKQLKQAEELLFSGPQEVGFAKELFFGRFLQQAILPYPAPAEAEREAGDRAVRDVRQFVTEKIDPAKIDAEADIPLDTIRGLGAVGVLGATIAPEYGGRGLTQQNYCRMMEVIGGHCAATAVFVNAHHSIGLRALQLFGTESQRQKWMGPLARGEKIAAFALTEPEAGSDAANVRTTAHAAPDGKGFILNGQKRYITNGGIAQVLTVMARTHDPQDPDGKVTAFLVTPDMSGFEVVDARMPKCGIRGTATARLAFRDMYVPRENILGTYGKGLRLALTVLDFGRTTFGASCTGAAKFCLDKAVEYARARQQFGKYLGDFHLVKQKIAQAAANTFAMESATYHTAALIDRGAEDYMLETAMLKVFASDALWTIVNDTLQIYGGAGYFCDQPFERMMRDARINLIGEGANDVLRSFVGGVGLRHLGLELLEITKHWSKVGLLRRSPPAIPVPHSRLQPAVARYSRQISQFARQCQLALIRHREDIVNQQYILARLGDTAMELFVSGCVYSRLVTLIQHPDADEARMRKDMQSGILYLDSAWRRNARRLAELTDNDDAEEIRTADAFLSPGGHH